MFKVHGVENTIIKVTFSPQLIYKFNTIAIKKNPISFVYGKTS